ncbi:DinB family protein [Terrimonas sp. NA20]|uniref:DinB family protein n=1 Tax=Terrimonas ginsenosidimutans TaxID=2908004 RepID=A0ABS9KSP8_9BACT|nr:DinB family protein [Terrimonas ginsenosidimutans]MCG2615300.1 DinB family protein [Terrimonas ginsenosidimutans]
MEPTIQPFLGLLREIYIGGEGKDTFVIDRDPGHGVISAIKTVSASDASTPSHDGGTTIAAHTGHLKWSLDYAFEFYKGKIPEGWNWDDSWTRFSVNDEEWEILQDELAASYERLVTTINNVKDWSEPMLLKGTLALLPHASYHLGAIKQLILSVKTPEKTAMGLQ